MPLFAIVVVISNLIFIPIYGINGAAIASLISIIVYNTIRFFLVKIKLDIQPFSINTIKIIAILSVSYFAGHINIFNTEYSLLNIIIRSIQIMTPFIILVLIIKPSEDIQLVIENLKSKFQ